MKLWKWTSGRQADCQYKKLPILFFNLWKFGFDIYILKYEAQTFLPPHKDELDGKHYRLNIKLKGLSSFYCQKNIFSNSWITLFRPDLYIHSLNVITETTKLSFGFAKFN